MNLVLIRVDDRLIHGQITEAWVPYLRVKKLVVVDDNVAKDPMRKSILELAVPSDISILIKGIDDFVTDYLTNSLGDENTIVLFSNPTDALIAYERGMKFQELNLGNVHPRNIERMISETICLSSDDLKSLSQLSNAGVTVSIKTVPNEKPIDFNTIIKK